MPQPLNFPCANCGAHLTVDGSSQTPTCAYCHTQTLLPQEIWLRFHPPVSAAPRVFAAPTPQKTGAWVWAVPVVGIAIIAGVAVIATRSSAPVDPLASAGDPCSGRTAACSKDKKASLKCGAGDKMVVTDTCKGPNGCQVSADGSSVSCDTTFADVKDPCDTTDDSCATDHKAELACVAGHFSVRATCKGPDGCTLTPAKKGGYTLSCDDHVADIGDPCFDSERTACSTDHQSLLTCTAQKYVVDRACKGPRGCSMTKNIGGKTLTVDCDGPTH